MMLSMDEKEQHNRALATVINSMEDFDKRLASTSFRELIAKISSRFNDGTDFMVAIRDLYGDELDGDVCRRLIEILDANKP